MKLISLAIQGFRSFKQDQVFEFPQNEAGLYLVSGDNQVEPELGANGAGKSTLWDAVVWCLYGRTSRGLRAGSVANWERDHLCSVTLEFELRGELYAVLRTWDPNTLVLERYTDGYKQEPQIVTQAELEDLLDVDFATFMNTVLMGQFNQFFFDLSSSQKLQVFSDALDLQSWLDAADRAKEETKSKREELHKLDTEIAAHESFISSMKGWLVHFKETAAKFERSRAKNIKRLKKAVRDLKSTIVAAGDAHDKSRIQHKIGVKRVEKVKLRLSDLEEDCDVLREERQLAKEKVRAAKSDREQLKERIAEVAALVGSCPLCEQPVGEDYVEACHSSLKVKLEQAQGKVTTRLAEYEKVGKRFDAQADLVAVAVEDLAAVLADQEERAEALKDTKTYLTKLIQDRDSLIEDVGRAKEEENPELENLRKCEIDIEEREHTLVAVRRNYVTTTRELDRARYWQKEFKNLRLWIIEQALTELEIHVNSSLVELGLSGWKVLFDVEKPKSDGKSFSKGFAVFITPPGFDAPVIWESWSGGETQRLRIAGAIGLSALISSRRGFDPSVEIWDEPTAHLSREGIEDLLKFLGARARKERRQLFLVDHRSLNAGDFDDEYMIVKTKAGSYINQATRKGLSITANTPAS